MAVHKKEKGLSQNSGKSSHSNNDNKVKQGYGKNNKPNDKVNGYSIGHTILVIVIAASFALIHSYHVSSLFENDRHFSHLSTLEREMTFRSEMGMYYSYYKTIVEAPTVYEGFYEIIHNNLTEFPSVINTLERFNLFPEVFLGILYRAFDWMCDKFGIVGKQCWQIERGQGLSPVNSCEGLRQPEYFYLEAVWFCSGLTTTVLFLYGVLLSGSIFGGLITVLCFFYNHGEATRVQWTPPLRESFAYPFCLLQMLCVSSCLNMNQDSDDKTVSTKKHKIQIAAVVITTSICLTLWQFSQFLLVTQVVAILALFTFGFISKFSAMVVLMGEMIAVALTLLLMFGNELLLSSLLTCLLMASLITLKFLYPVLISNHYRFVSGIMSMGFVASLTIVLRTRTLTTKHDAHILNILRSKLSSYNDFHTLLYTCSAEFDFLGWDPVIKLTKSLILPAVAFILLILVIHCFFSSLKFRSIDPHVAYNILQLGAFTVMAIMIMRLKLFFTPHLCIMASLLASRKYFKKLQREYHYSLLIVFIGCMSVSGVSNLLEQHSILGEYSNIELEELLVWIMRNTNKNAVFAGPMPITAAILLSTRRPIVNHPHYEDAMLRERTKKVYSAFSRKPPEDIFKTLSSLQVEYLVLSETWCFNQNRSGCRMTDLWDVEDPENQGRPPTCPKLFVGVFPFRLVFSNDVYSVLKLQPPYVELKGFNKY
ncbi:protein C-mannosyl-transferase DPY19L1-like [Halyomorpha halys]|uniref:protein C-mannosyl-transferase DPY19L1-like n=2 Tax=Halyomorpha halys TaxID=286706 RepID=UPI0006D4D99D|nr:probable C-mannosyltransferase DPY19L1 [Halyomorpha halys]